VISLSSQGLATRQVVDFRWFQFGNEWLKLGWMLDPLTAIMLVMVTFVSLLLLFMCWELVGLTSYLLIGFWYHKPEAAAAAKKAFIVTRIGDLGFFIGIAWLYAQTGTLLFYDAGAGCLEHSALAAMVTHITAIGMAASTGIA